MPVNSKHEDYSSFSEKWAKVKDSVSGQDAVKAKKTLYLPKPLGWDSTRYTGYLFRSTFVEFSKRVLDVSCGQIFRRPPVTENIPDEFTENIDLRGTSFDYFWRQVASELMQTNRVGIFIDYNEDKKRPFLVMYKAESIINWRTSIINGIDQLSLLVVEGYAIKNDSSDKYKPEKEKMWKVFEIEDGRFVVRDYLEEKTRYGLSFVLVSEYYPEINSFGGEKNYFAYIPFFLITSNGISTELISPPLLSIVNLNLGHFRNYADLEAMLYMTAQKTIITKGLSKEEEKKPFPVGGAVNFREASGDAHYMEASSDSGLREELTHKETMMAALGSSFLQNAGRYIQSSETARLSSSSEFATLADISNSLSVSATKIMSILISWAENKDVECSIEFNTDFETANIDPALLSSLVAALGSGYISEETFFYNLKTMEMYPPDMTAQDEKKLIELSQKKKIELRDSIIGEKFDVQPSTD